MPTWIALFRGINVGGRNKVPMAKLTATLEGIGCHTVRTYIQSGNAVFSSSLRSKPKLAKRIGDAVESDFGFRPAVLLLSERELASAIENNPFPDAEPEPKSLHVFFLGGTPKPGGLKELEKLASASERFQYETSLFYLHSPEGFARSKIATRLERTLGVDATARNFATVRNIADLLSGR